MAPDREGDTNPKSTPVPVRGAKGRSRPGKPAARAGAPGTASPSAGGGGAAARRRAAAARQRKRRQTMLAVGMSLLVVVVIAVLVVVKLSSNSTSSASGGSSGAKLSTAQYSDVTSPSIATLSDAARNYTYEKLSYPSGINDTALSQDGKPEVLYIGAEYCPYCATERWPLTIALSKFGTFHGLSKVTSNTADAGIEHLATLSYYESTYSSPYLAFEPVELQDTHGRTLDTPTAAETALLKKYTGGDIPFVDFAGKAAITGAELDPHLLAGLDQTQIINQVRAGSSTLASNIDADAGAIVSNLCQITGGQPGNVCSAFPHAMQSKTSS